MRERICNKENYPTVNSLNNAVDNDPEPYYLPLLCQPTVNEIPTLSLAVNIMDNQSGIRLFSFITSTYNWSIF